MKILIATLAIFLSTTAWAGIFAPSTSSGSGSTTNSAAFVIGVMATNNAATANYATTAETLGVILIRGNSTTQYFGFAGSAFTNALQASVSGDTVRVGVGWYTNGLEQPGFLLHSGVTVRGSGQTPWDTNLLTFLPGGTTIGPLRYASDGTCSNICVANLNILGTNGAFIGSGNYSNNAKLLLENVSMGQVVRTPTWETFFLVGKHINILNVSLNNMGGHGPVFKGCDDLDVDGLFLDHCGDAGAESIMIEPNNSPTSGNGNNTNMRFRHVRIHNGGNNAIPIFIDFGDNSVGDNIEFDDVQIDGDDTLQLPVISIGFAGTNSVASNIRFNNVTCKGNAISQFLYPAVPAGNLVSNVFVSNCSLVTTQAFSLPSVSGLTFANLQVNGKSFFTSGPFAPEGLPIAFQQIRDTNSVGLVSNQVVIVGGSGGGNIQIKGAPTYGNSQMGATISPGDVGFYNYGSTIYIKGGSGGGAILDNNRDTPGLIYWSDAGVVSIPGLANVSPAALATTNFTGSFVIGVASGYAHFKNGICISTNSTP
jgi:hypothetical protein